MKQLVTLSIEVEGDCTSIEALRMARRAVGDEYSKDEPEGSRMLTVPRKYNQEERTYEGPQVQVTLVKFSVGKAVE